jgi:hypothetical protein
MVFLLRRHLKIFFCHLFSKGAWDKNRVMEEYKLLPITILVRSEHEK